jgi:hypothetical protein
MLEIRSGGTRARLAHISVIPRNVISIYLSVYSRQKCCSQFAKGVDRPSVPLSLHNPPPPRGPSLAAIRQSHCLLACCYSECGVGWWVLFDGGLHTPTRALAGLRGGGMGAGQACV